MNSVLFKEMQIGKLRVGGRVFKTATSETRASEDGFVTDELLEFYEPITCAGTPLIISGNLYVSKEGKSTYRMCGIDSDDKVPGLRRWADLVHGHSSLLFAQINHCGRQVLPKAIGLSKAVSASNVREKVMGTKPRPMTTDEIQETVDSFASAAERACTAGFDGVQIHAGHGYLINQFLTPYTNRRTDQYGGSFQNRLRFAIEVLRAVRSRVGDDFPVIAKINGSDCLPGRPGLSTTELVEITRVLQEEGLDGVEITVGHYESGFPMIRGRFDTFFKPLMKEGTGNQLSTLRRVGINLSRPAISVLFNRLWPHYQGFNLEYAGQFKEALSIPVICVGGFQTKEKMEQAIEDGHCDAVSVARAMIADPLLYQHLREGVAGPKCNFCNGCIARAGRLPIDCYDPAINKEKNSMLTDAGLIGTG